MFEGINRRASIGARVGMVAALAAPPVALLLYLFVGQLSRDIQVVGRELQGADYIGKVWPALVAAGEGVAPPAQLPLANDPLTTAFHVGPEARAFDAARGEGRLMAAVVLIRAVGDGSGLTLDTELASYYTMDAVTVKLPRLMAAVAAVSRATGPQERAFAMGQVVNFADATAYDMRQAIGHDSTGRVRSALTARAAGLASAVAGLRDPTADAARDAAVERSVDESWKADRDDLVRMLRVREARLQTRLALNLSLVIVCLGLAVMLMAATARGVTGRLRGLIKTMDHLNAGDTDVAIPYLTDGHETGRIAAMLEAFRQGLIDAVAERKRVETAHDAQRRSEGLYRTLADNVTDIILCYDMQSRIDYVSPSISQLGYAPEEFVGQAAGKFVHPDDVERVARRREQVFEGQPGGSLEARVRRADDRWVWLESSLSLLRDDDGNPVGAVAVMRDINERKAAELALKESEARYRLLADNTNDMILLYDLDGMVVYASPSVSRYGYTPDQVVGTRVGDFAHPDDKGVGPGMFAEAKAGKIVRPAEWRVRAADGSWVWVEGSPSLMRDDQGQMVGFLAVLRVIDERKAAEMALREVNAELRRVARVSALGAFATSIAHEINQPLAAVVTNSEASMRWLGAEPRNVERAVEAIGRAARDARRASEVVGRMRAMVAKEPVKDADFDINDAINEVLMLTQREQQTLQVQLTLELAPDALVVRGDRIQFQQVILNLVLNAIDAMRECPAGERRLIVRTLAQEKERVRVEVEDRGSGIAADAIDQIFDHLFTTKLGGTGLGLTISRSIVEAHGGRIWAEAATPRGAVFKVDIPRSGRASA